MPCSCGLIRPKQLVSMAATARVIWLCVKSLAGSWVGVFLCHKLLLFERSYLCCRLCQMRANSSKKKQERTTHPLPRTQKLITNPLQILFDQSLTFCKCSVVKLWNEFKCFSLTLRQTYISLTSAVWIYSDCLWLQRTQLNDFLNRSNQ